MRKIIILLFAIVACVGKLFASVTIGGIEYNLDETKLTAEVTRKSSSYSYSIVIPSSVSYNDKTYSVTSIGEKAFYNCTALTSVTIPKSVTSIGYKAFYECGELTSITILCDSAYVQHAFWRCPKLTRVNIADLADWCKITFVDYGANPLEYAGHLYLKGSEIKELTVPSSITSIGSYAFAGCNGLISVTIPNSVTRIGSCAFVACKGLMSVTIPNSVTNIGNYAFEGCNGLTSVTIPNGVKTIELGVFQNCTGLTSVTIPNSVTCIYSEAFKGSGLTSVTIPNSVTEIWEEAFANCLSLTSVTCYAIAPPEMISYSTHNNKVFDSVDVSKIPLYVPAESISAYKSAKQWNEFGSILPINTGQSIDEVVNGQSSNGKFLINGHFYILRDGKMYDMTGKEVR